MVRTTTLRASDGDGGEVSWFLTLPPHGVNHSRELTKYPFPHIYKRAECKRWEHYAQATIEGWVPPERVSLTVLIEFAVGSALLRRIDADKWAASVIDGVIGPRADQWIDHLTVTKVLAMGEGGVAVTIQWDAQPTRRRQPPR